MHLGPLPYHLRMRDFLNSRHPDLWEWFQSTESQSDYSDAVQLELLKTTYRMERPAHGSLYDLVDGTVTALGLEGVPVTLYQAQGAGSDSAALYFTPGHGHVVFEGRVLQLLDDAEVRALIGHELAHFKLWTADSSDFLVCDRILTAMVNEPHATPGHLESARLWQLYTEVYADRGSTLVSDDHVVATSMLVKLVTGLASVDPAGYVRQAEDVFAKGQHRTEGLTHPEPYIRARALALWCGHGDRGDGEGREDGEVELEITRMIEGPRQFDDLDLLGQEALVEATRRLLWYHLRGDWLRTSGKVSAHAGMFFPGGFESGGATLEEVRADWDGGDGKLRDYACYLLLDFAAVDPDLEENALAASFVTADELGLGDRFEDLARKELKLLKRDSTRVRKAAASMVGAASKEVDRDS